MCKSYLGNMNCPPNIRFHLTTLLLLPLNCLLLLLDDTIGNVTHFLYDHSMDHPLLQMIEAWFFKPNACVQVIHAYTMMQFCNTTKQAKYMGMKRRGYLVNILLRWRFISELEWESVSIFTQTTTLKPITGVLETDPKFISIMTLESYGLLVYSNIINNLPGLLNYLG